jgi:hypothetical protein
MNFGLPPVAWLAPQDTNPGSNQVLNCKTLQAQRRWGRPLPLSRLPTSPHRRVDGLPDRRARRRWFVAWGCRAQEERGEC